MLTHGPVKRFPFWLALAVSVVGFGVSRGVATSLEREAQHDAQQTFDFARERLVNDFVSRLERARRGLRGTAAMFATHEGLPDLRTYVARRDLTHEFPGVLGLGFIERVPDSDLARWAVARGVTPQQLGAGPHYVVSTIEPLEPNRAVLGYDSGSDPVRRAVIERVIATGSAQVSAPIRLVQLPGRTGVLLFEPVFTGDPRTAAERERALRGLVYAPVVFEELLEGVLDAADRQLDFDVYDQSEGTPQLLYDPDGHQYLPAPRVAQWDVTSKVAWAGRAYEVRVLSTPLFEAKVRHPFWPALVVGLVLSVLIAALAWQLASGRQKALDAAARVTLDLRSAVHENRALLDTINTHFVVSTADANGTVLWANQAMFDVSGFSREELLGQNHRVLNSKVHPPEFWQEMWARIGAGQSWRGEVCNRRRDGSLYWVDTLIAPMPDLDGKPNRFISIRADITSRKEVEAELQRQTKLAEQASLTKSSFLANMSHEIRTPMNGVLGMTELLLGMDLNAEQQEAARIIYRSAEALLSLLNDILDFSKIEAGKVEFEDLAWDPSPVAYDVAELFRPKVLGRGVELLVRVRPGTPAKLRGDAARVRQILVNLVGNAVKFIERGHVLLDVRLEGEQLVFEVSDTGPGIPAERQRILFQPFTQADAATSRRFGGTGLGLAISRRLAAGLGGTLEFTSREGEGTTFVLKIPARSIETPAPARPLEGLAVVVEEPSALQRSILTEQLRELGAQVEAPDDPFALRLWSKTDVVVWSDAILPTALPPGPVHVVQLTRPGPNALPHVARCASSAVLGQVIARAVSRSAAPSNVVTLTQAPRSRHLAVLLAEDNHINQRVACAMLEKCGCKVTLAADGSDAVAAFQRGAFDLVLMDCQMPDVDGFDATRAIRAWEASHERARTPVIALTANASAEDRSNCLAAGMDDHLSKPLRAANLEALLERLFGALNRVG
ncbi:MAG: CHASE domain-containing protein [Myxococcaceae bacterium]